MFIRRNPTMSRIGFWLPALAIINLKAAYAGSCENLTALTIPQTSVTSAIAMPAGPFSPGGGRTGAARPFPAFCRVAAVARPVPDSEIRIEVWLPDSAAWNGKMLGTGNGGYSGALGYGDMERALRLGYAVAGSDTGHEGGDLKFGLGHPEKINDWAWRAVHVMTDTAKLVARSYYGRFAAHSYFSGCSTGGQQALTEAQRFPADYDGILAGAPGNNRVRLNVGFLWSWRAANDDDAAPLPVSKLPVIHKAAVAACDPLDGVADGIIGDPLACKFDPGTLECRGGESPDCLTKSQVAAVRAIYEGARNPRTGERLYPGWVRGSETGWQAYFVGQREPARLDFWRYWVFHDPNWDFRSFDFDRDVTYADSRVEFLTANDPDLRRFGSRGGKLLLYQGFADPVVPPEDSIRYYESVVRTMSAENASKVARLFLIPGMGHCSGGPGPSSFEGLAALD
ncbi:MAG TPA: tannase/feruloyl esterase family alpha/beta hydrolase, partial [Bryobacteraceae bacterium]